jgi:hypothetical protein
MYDNCNYVVLMCLKGAYTRKMKILSRDNGRTFSNCVNRYYFFHARHSPSSAGPGRAAALLRTLCACQTSAVAVSRRRAAPAKFFYAVSKRGTERVIKQTVTYKYIYIPTGLQKE